VTKTIKWMGPTQTVNQSADGPARTKKKKKKNEERVMSLENIPTQLGHTIGKEKSMWAEGARKKNEKNRKDTTVEVGSQTERLKTNSLMPKKRIVLGSRKLRNGKIPWRKNVKATNTTAS